jgi:hypothetical protein
MESDTRNISIIAAGGVFGVFLACALELAIFSDALASVTYYNVYGLLMTMAVVAPFIEEPLKLLGFGFVKISKWTEWNAIKAGMCAGLCFGILETSFFLYSMGSSGLLEPTAVLALVPVGMHVLASGLGGLGAYYGHKRYYGRMLKYIVLAIALHLIWNVTGLLIGIIACVVAYRSLTKHRKSKTEKLKEAREIQLDKNTINKIQTEHKNGEDLETIAKKHNITISDAYLAIYERIKDSESGDETRLRSRPTTINKRERPRKDRRVKLILKTTKVKKAKAPRSPRERATRKRSYPRNRAT